jgi:hypothetical protein
MSACIFKNLLDYSIASLQVKVQQKLKPFFQQKPAFYFSKAHQMLKQLIACNSLTTVSYLFLSKFNKAYN